MENSLPEETALNINAPQDGGNKTERGTPGEDEIVLPDECGDTLWDKVLAQQGVPLVVSHGPGTEPSLNRIDDEQISGATESK